MVQVYTYTIDMIRDKLISLCLDRRSLFPLLLMSDCFDVVLICRAFVKLAFHLLLLSLSMFGDMIRLGMGGVNVLYNPVYTYLNTT
jgi:hypothetical protein